VRLIFSRAPAVFARGQIFLTGGRARARLRRFSTEGARACARLKVLNEKKNWIMRIQEFILFKTLAFMRYF
jgi:hypothetical protein